MPLVSPVRPEERVGDQMESGWSLLETNPREGELRVKQLFASLLLCLLSQPPLEAVEPHLSLEMP